jgi:hypothetical protein
MQGVLGMLPVFYFVLSLVALEFWLYDYHVMFLLIFFQYIDLCSIHYLQARIWILPIL